MTPQTVRELIEWILAIYLGLVITRRLLIAYKSLFETIPPGQSKEWTFSIPSGHGLALNFTNLDGKQGKWTLSAFKITRRN